MEKVSQINEVIKAFFERNTSVTIVPAKDLMPHFIRTGIFPKDQKNGLPIRSVLRKLDRMNQLHLIPGVYAERKPKNTNWYFVCDQSIGQWQRNIPSNDNKEESKLPSRKNSDEQYVVDLCDEVIGIKGSRQHRFEFLLGDADSKGSRRKLPVDVYYPELNLVIEYKEHQHSQPVKFFDKPGAITVSGVDRGEQRMIYDKRRVIELPKYGIELLEISYSTFNCNGNNRIIRDHGDDILKVKALLSKYR